MSAPVKYDPAGVAITDEKLIFAESEVIGEVTYYIAWAANITDQAIEGDDSPTYGVWTAVSKGGTRQTVLLEGVPSANEVTWDITTGKILSLAQTSLYARYMGYGQILEVPQAILHYPMEMTDGVTNIDWIVRKLKRNCTIEKYEIAVDGALAGTEVTLQLRTAIGGAGSTQNMTLAASTRSSGITDLSSPLAFSAEDSFVIRGDGKNISLVTITLY